MKTDFIVGKVKTVFSTSEPEEVLIQYEDKVTAGNGRKVDFPVGKGKVCCKISEFLFEKLEEKGIRTHYISTIPERIMCCKRVEIIPIEVVVRNVAAGSIVRQTTLEEGRIFNWPLVEYYLKDDEKDDPLLTDDRVSLMGYDPHTFRRRATEMNFHFKNIFSKMDIDVVDFKLEYGHDGRGGLYLADELSPDNMRLWKKGTRERFDKDLFRKGEGNIVEAYKHILHNLLLINNLEAYMTR